MRRVSWNIMDTHAKAGQVYLQHRNAEKKWKQLWLALYPSSRCGVARLERQEMGGGERAGASVVWKHQDKVKEKRVIRLSEVIRVLRLPPHAEACPKDNMAAFCVETDGRRYVFAADKDDCVEWVERMCDIAFQGRSTGQQPQLQMEDNQIYVSREEVSEFRVGVKQTDAAVRCGLQGEYYWLQVAQEGLVLKEAETRKSLQPWPYQLLRRYGRDKMTFSIEAGRRSESGPGTFTFETRQADDIFSLIETAIREQKASAFVGDDREGDTVVAKRSPNMPRARSPLPRLPDSAAILEGSYSFRPVFSNAIGSEQCVYSQLPNLIGSEECLYSEPADSIKPKAPGLNSYLSPLTSSTLTPSIPLYPRNHHGNRTEPVYADPADILSLIPPRSTPPPPPPTSSSCSHHHGNETEPVYSEVYDRVSPLPDQTQQQNQNQGGQEPGKAEPIYSEPCVGTPVKGPNTDPFAHLYSQVCKPGSSSPSSSSSSSSSPSSSLASSSSSSSSSSLTITRTLASRRPTAGRQSPEVIYENMGVI